MKTQKAIYVFIILIYVSLIYITPASYINKPAFLLLQVARFPLRLCQKITYGLYYLAQPKDYIQENKILRRTIDVITHQLAQHRETEAENRRLRKLLAFKKKSPFKLVAARIIGKDSSNISDTILIDQGVSSGVEKDRAVITEAGLVGRVIEASSNISRVMLITDPNSRVSAVVSRSRQMGVVYGTSSKVCKMRYLPLDADIELGDEIVTSGFSDVYPKGVLIGRVIKVATESSGLTLFALVKPAVDLSTIEELLCIE